MDGWMDGWMDGLMQMDVDPSVLELGDQDLLNSLFTLVLPNYGLVSTRCEAAP